MLKNKILGALASQEEKIFSDDVFSTHLYTGTGSSRSINNGVDLAGKGGMVWVKRRDSADNHSLTYSGIQAISGTGVGLKTNTTDPRLSTAGVGAFTSSGFNLDNTGGFNFNLSGANYTSWAFRNADKFYGHAVVTKTAGSNATVSFANLGTLGMVRVKRTDDVGSWYVWHRSLAAGQLLIGETLAAAATLGQVTVSGTTVTLVNGVISDGTYLVEAFAHDTAADGIIQCGSFTTDVGGNATVSLGWEPQFILAKVASQNNNWFITDSMRGMPVSTNGAQLWANSPQAEVFQRRFYPYATGFSVESIDTSSSYIYLAIRRPNKPPTTGGQVFAPDIGANVSAGSPQAYDAGFPVDLALSINRGGGTDNAVFIDRLRGGSNYLASTSTAAEATGALRLFDSMTGVKYNGTFNFTNYCGLLFRRAPGFFDVAAYTGDGTTNGSKIVPHSLGVTPELVIIKNRSSTADWAVAVAPGPLPDITGAYNYLLLNTTDQQAQNPSSNAVINGFVAQGRKADFRVAGSNGAVSNVNAAGVNYIAYLFATLPGISKVGSYTGNGTSQTISCGFTTGARFFLTKATSTTGNWWVYDSARGIISAADPALTLNSTAAEITSADAVDPDPSGIIVNQEASCNINSSGVTYIFLAIS